jgi:hypothetical protein
VRIPRTYQEALLFDKINGNHKWEEACKNEIECLLITYECFKALQKGEEIPEGYTEVPLLWAFDVKFDGRHRGRLVAGGHKTWVDPEEGYSSTVSLDDVRMAFVAAVLMKLGVITADVSHAYIRALCKEKRYTIAGPEFGEIAGRVLIIIKALYGLRTSGAAWHAEAADTLRALGFWQSKAGNDIWMREQSDHYEYVTIFVDDLLVFSRNAREVIDVFECLYGVKGVGFPEYYNGGDVYEDEDGKLCLSAKTYIKQVAEKIESLLESKLKCYGSPLEPGDHPEMDESDLLGEEDIAKYQMLCGCAQWAVSLGRFDVQYAVNTMARFGVCPREGHLKRMLRIFGYLKYHTKARIKFDMDEPLIDSLDFKNFEWNELYPEATEEIAYDTPCAKETEKDVFITCHCDSDHGHDLLTRRSVTGYVISINKTPVKFYSKRQNTVESSSYGSELVAGRIATEAIMEFRYKLRMLGIKIDKPSILMIDNQSVVANTTLPSSTIKKKHNSIAYHRMREAVAAGIIKVGYIRSATNLADILTKPVGPADYWNHLSEVLYGRERSLEGELQESELSRDQTNEQGARTEVSGANIAAPRPTPMVNRQNSMRMSGRSQWPRNLVVEPQFRPRVRWERVVPRTPPVSGPRNGTAGPRRERRDQQDQGKLPRKKHTVGRAGDRRHRY